MVKSNGLLRRLTQRTDSLEGLTMTTFLLFIFAGVSGGALAYALLPYLTGGARVERRLETLTKRSDAPNEIDAKRKKLTENIKKLEEQKTANGRAPLEARLQQTGLPLTKTSFLAASAAGGMIAFLFMLASTGSLMMSLGGGFIAAVGVPNWVINYLIKKRMTRFTNEFPGCLDIITRGVKAGLPLNECLNIIANEAPDPINIEFQKLVEAQQMGMSLGSAVQRLALRMPSSEANFFAIAVSIQQQSGGNLAEALSNLSRVLRERKQMKQKIKAMSTEATASAGIIACMPPGVALMVYFSSPDYISLLWTTPTGQVTLLICGFWMTLGILVMRKMINFEI